MYNGGTYIIIHSKLDLMLCLYLFSVIDFPLLRKLDVTYHQE